MTYRKSLRGMLLASACLSSAVFAMPALAQSYDRDGSAYVPENVIVHAPPYRAERSVIGAPIEDVAISREVRFDDLDLSTHYGARELRNRVRETAQGLCNRLNVAYPAPTSDSPPCYQTALKDAMYQADRAIYDARSRAD